MQTGDRELLIESIAEGVIRRTYKTHDKRLYVEKLDTKGRLIEAFFACPSDSASVGMEDRFCRMCGTKLAS